MSAESAEAQLLSISSMAKAEEADVDTEITQGIGRLSSEADTVPSAWLVYLRGTDGTRDAEARGRHARLTGRQGAAWYLGDIATV